MKRREGFNEMNIDENSTTYIEREKQWLNYLDLVTYLWLDYQVNDQRHWLNCRILSYQHTFHYCDCSWQNQMLSMLHHWFTLFYYFLDQSLIGIVTDTWAIQLGAFVRLSDSNGVVVEKNVEYLRSQFECFLNRFVLLLQKIRLIE
jgi:hypothetical protein